MEKINKYFSKHVYLNSIFHVVGGIGIGVLLTHPYFDPHPLRYGIILLLVGLLGHGYAYISKK